jgi:glycosyltransferase involved in cell wall biosynthesis
MMEIADILIPNSKSEADQLRRFFLIPEGKISQIPNGVDPVFENASPDLFRSKFKFEKFVLCVGRIEPRKNQLNMIRALNRTDIPFVIIGDHVKHYPEYYQACRKEAGPNIHFLGGMPHDSEILRSAYAACDTLLLASWLETPGLAALEAALAGAKVVITQEGATREYFRDLVGYTNPSSVKDIQIQTSHAYGLPKDGRLQDLVRRDYQWKHIANKVLVEYQRLLRL